MEIITDKVVVFIVTYNSARTIKVCLNSLMDSPCIEKVVVVDNSSADGTLGILKSFKGTKLRVILSGGNLGFSKGNNLGFNTEQPSGFVMFLNPDTRFEDNQDIAKLLQILKDNQEYGLIGPRMIHKDRSLQLTVRNNPTIFNAFKEYILRIKNAYDFYDPQGAGLCEVETVVGACMMMSSATFKKVGCFDEKFFLYYEDITLCQNIRGLGKKIGYDKDVTIEHIEGESGKGQSVSQLLINSAKIYHGLFGYMTLTFIIKIGMMWQRIVTGASSSV